MVNLKNYVIVLPKAPTYNERRAADFIVSCVKIVAGYKLKTVDDTAPPTDFELVIGRTAREKLDGIIFDRKAGLEWESEIKCVKDRIYLTGFGVNTEDPSIPFSKTAYLTDGAYGTVFAAYRFVEKVLGYNFIYSVHEIFPIKETVEFEPNEIADKMTSFEFENELPVCSEGNILYAIPSVDLNKSINSLIIKAESGKLAVIDGGTDLDASHLSNVIRALSDDEKPTVEKWFLTSASADHIGAVKKILESHDIEIKAICHSFLPESFYTGKESFDKALYDTVVNSDISSRVDPDDCINIDGIKITAIRTPSPDNADIKTVGDASSVLRIDTKDGKSVTVLGSAERSAICELENYPPDKLKSDVLVFGNASANAVSSKLCSRIAPSECLFEVLEREWYGEKGEGLYTTNLGIIRARASVIESGTDIKSIYRNTHGTFALSLDIRR